MNTQDESWLEAAWMQTYTGQQFRPFQPDPSAINLEDIAHALSMICRFGGHVREFYSVAQHCLLVSRNVPVEDAVHGLLHDATEAYVGDMVRPLKIGMPAYKAVEDGVWRAICQRFDIDPMIPESVHEADRRILLNERGALLGSSPADWEPEVLEPLPIPRFELRHPDRPRLAEDRFLRAAEILGLS